MLSVIVNGINGQMGHAVYTACQASDGAFCVVAGVDAAETAGSFACPVYNSFSAVRETADVIIDFSIPTALPDVLRYALNKRLPAVIGTTGLSERDKKLIKTASERIPVFQTGNMSLGVNLQEALVRTASAALGPDFDVEIIEKHHRKKVDAPSGTALMLADTIRSASTDDIHYEFGRHEKNKRRTNGEIGFHSVRGGTIVGEHEVMFIGNDEIVEITHKAYSKQVFARGALRAAQYIAGKQNGLYNMQNVVTEHDVASHLYTLDEQAVVILTHFPDSPAVCSKAFSLLAGQSVNLDMIAVTLGNSSCEIGFSLKQSQLKDALDALRPLQKEYPDFALTSHANVVKLTVEGSGMALRHGVAARLFSLLAAANIRVQLITTSETKIELCIDAIDAAKAVEEIQNNLMRELR